MLDIDKLKDVISTWPKSKIIMATAVLIVIIQAVVKLLMAWVSKNKGKIFPNKDVPTSIIGNVSGK